MWGSWITVFQHLSFHIVRDEKSSGDGFVTLAPDFGLKGRGCVLEHTESLIFQLPGWSEAAASWVVASVMLGRYSWKPIKSLLLLQPSLFTF